jgi:ABC-type multidrug transport system fused ATPase/permease subunit
MMIENGSVLGYGTHEYLLNTLEEYRHIFESQMGDRDINTSSKGGVYNE